MSKAAEARTTGGNTNIDYNLRVKLGFPDGNLNIDGSKVQELTDNGLLRYIIEIFEMLYSQYFDKLNNSELKRLDKTGLLNKINALRLYAEY
jgi:hypothetical protein